MANVIQKQCDLCFTKSEAGSHSEEKDLSYIPPPSGWKTRSLPTADGKMIEGLLCPSCQVEVNKYLQKETEEIARLRKNFIFEFGKRVAQL